MTLLMLGEFISLDPNEYSYGGGLNSYLAGFLFLISCFVLVIHLMNMLIAIMGEV